MKYTILIYETPSDFTARTDERVMTGGAALQPAHLATTVRPHEDKQRVAHH